MRIMLVGDIHGSSMALEAAMMEAMYNKVDRVFFLGDFGYTFSPKFMKAADDCYRGTGLYVDFVDGNHEDFDFIYSFPVSEDGYRYMSQGMRHIPRGTVLDLDGKNVLCLGGATSIDRAYRLASEGRTGHKSYWKQESITEADVINSVDSAGKYDVIHAMFTHDSPVLPEESNKVDCYLDDVERTRSQVNRDKLSWVVRKAKPAYLYHGHHHTVHEVDFEGTHVVGLPHSDHPWDDHTMIVDTESWV